MTSPSNGLITKARNSGIQKQPRKGTRSCFECRRRKLRCIFAPKSSICHECLARGARCIGQGAADQECPVDNRKPLGPRVDRLERLMEQFLEQQISHNESRSDSSPFHIQSTLNSHDAGLFPLRTSARAPINSLIGNAVFSSSEENQRSAAESSSSSSPLSEVRGLCPRENMIKATGTTTANLGNVFVTKKMKDETVINTLVSALPQEEKTREVLKKHQSWWTHIGRRFQAESATENNFDLQHFFRDAVFNANPTSVARIIQFVASEMEESECEKLLLLIDKLIICDDEYMNTMGGLNCALWQNRLLMDTGQAQRAWLASRRALMSVQLLGLHRTCVDTQQELIWWTLFQVDRSASLMLGTPYAIPDTQCHISCPGLFMNNPHEDGLGFGILTTQLGILAGKVIDRVHAVAELTYESALDIDQELNQLAKQIPANYWDFEQPFSTHVEDASSLVAKFTTHCTFNKIKLILHMPYMLNSFTQPEYESSRDACFNAAREIIHGYLKFRGQANALMYKMKDVDFIAFLACITLILGLLGDSRSHPQQEISDWDLIEAMISAYKVASGLPFGKIASQSHKALEQFAQYRHSSTDHDSNTIRKVVIPYFGTITVRRGTLKHSNNGVSGTNYTSRVEQVANSSPAQNIGTQFSEYPGNAHITYEGLYQPYRWDNLHCPDVSGLGGQGSQWEMPMFGDTFDMDQDWTWLTGDTQNHFMHP